MLEVYGGGRLARRNRPASPHHLGVSPSNTAGLIRKGWQSELSALQLKQLGELNNYTRT